MVENLEVYETVKPSYCWSDNEVVKLKQLYGCTEVETIAKLLGRSKDAVWSKADRMRLKRIDSKLVQPNLDPSETLCYVVGVMKGDGSVNVTRHYHYTVRLQVKDKAFVDSFKQALSKIGLHPRYVYKESDKRPAHTIVAYSRKFVSWYSGLSLKDIKALIEKPSFALGFIRGFYESEGSFVHVWRKKRHQHQWRLAIYNNDESLLMMVCDVLRTLGFNFHWRKPLLHPPHMFRGSLIVTRKPVCCIDMQSRQEISDFLSLVNPCIKGDKMKLMKDEGSRFR